MAGTVKTIHFLSRSCFCDYPFLTNESRQTSQPVLLQWPGIEKPRCLLQKYLTTILIFSKIFTNLDLTTLFVLFRNQLFFPLGHLQLKHNVG